MNSIGERGLRGQFRGPCGLWGVGSACWHGYNYASVCVAVRALCRQTELSPWLMLAQFIGFVDLTKLTNGPNGYG